jgi:hypothetical protein
MEQLLVILIILLAVFVQSLSGFGVALIAMAFLPGFVGIKIATPLVALVTVTIEVFLLLRYRTEINLRAVLPIAAAAVVGIPLGIWAFDGVDERYFLTGLGVVITVYAIYALLNIKTPELSSPVWAYAAGLIAGILGGAYNTSGPPVILYGNCRRWPPLEFKGNLQGFFIVSSSFVALGHAVGGNFTLPVWEHFLWTLPAIGVGYIAGTYLDRYLNPEMFRKLVLILLVLLGLRLILG